MSKKKNERVAHSAQEVAAVAAANKMPLSSLSPSFFFFAISLLYPPLSSSLCFVFKNRFGEAHARKAATRMVWRASRVTLRAVGACEASLLRSEPSKPVFWRCQNAKTNKIHRSSETKKILIDTLSVSKDMFL
jgi:hypothetical protein